MHFKNKSSINLIVVYIKLHWLFEIVKFNAWCYFTYRWSCLLNALEQMTQPYLRSSLWVSLCLAKALELLKLFPQTGQFTPGRFPGAEPILPGLPFARGLSGTIPGAAICEESESDDPLGVGCCSCDCCCCDCCWLRWPSLWPEKHNGGDLWPGLMTLDWRFEDVIIVGTHMHLAISTYAHLYVQICMFICLSA